MLSCKKFAITLLFVAVFSSAVISAEESANESSAPVQQDLSTSATSAKLFNLGSLFGQNPSNGYGNGYGYGNGNGYDSNYYPNSYRPNAYYPYKNNNYPTSTYPTSIYPSSYYPSSYYPSNSGWSGSNYPNYANNGGGYYPGTGGFNFGTSGAGYYPIPGSSVGTGVGTNILGGNGGYGGYGGNGDLNQYNGYWNPLYAGQRNRGYGYNANTDRYGLPRYDGGYNDRPYVGGGIYGAYRGYD